MQTNHGGFSRIEDFYTPYSPYEEQDDLAILQESTHNCIHVFIVLNVIMTNKF